MRSIPFVLGGAGLAVAALLGGCGTHDASYHRSSHGAYGGSQSGSPGTSATPAAQPKPSSDGPERPATFDQPGASGWSAAGTSGSSS